MLQSPGAAGGPTGQFMAGPCPYADQIATSVSTGSATALAWRCNQRTHCFHPETFSAQEVLNERNTEVRRVLFERVGYETFMEQAHAEVLDQDQDPGGTRRLLRVPLTGDEPLVCLGVYCPSTGRQYLLRVPPTMCSCHQAAAWIAGFDDPDQYRPLDET